MPPVTHCKAKANEPASARKCKRGFVEQWKSLGLISKQEDRRTFQAIFPFPRRSGEDSATGQEEGHPHNPFPCLQFSYRQSQLEGALFLAQYTWRFSRKSLLPTLTATGILTRVALHIMLTHITMQKRSRATGGRGHSSRQGEKGHYFVTAPFPAPPSSPISRRVNRRGRKRRAWFPCWFLRSRLVEGQY